MVEEEDQVYLDWLIEAMLRDEEKAMVEEEEDQAYLDWLIETMLRDEEKAMVEGEEYKVFAMKPIVIIELNYAVNLDMEQLVKQEVTISCSE